MWNHKQPKLQQCSLAVAPAYLARLWLHPSILSWPHEEFPSCGSWSDWLCQFLLNGKYCRSSLRVRESFISQRIFKLIWILNSSWQRHRIPCVGVASVSPAARKVLVVFWMSYFNTLGCGSLGVHFSWNLLSSLRVYILVFYQIWKVRGCFFFGFSLPLSSPPSSWDPHNVCTSPLGSVLSSLVFVFPLFFCLSILSSCSYFALCSDFLFLPAGCQSLLVVCSFNYYS